MNTAEFIKETNAEYQENYGGFERTAIGNEFHDLVHAAYGFISENGGPDNNYQNLMENLIFSIEHVMEGITYFRSPNEAIPFSQAITSSYNAIKYEIKNPYNRKKIRYPVAAKLETIENQSLYSAVIAKLVVETSLLRLQGAVYGQNLIELLLNAVNVDFLHYKNNKIIKNDVELKLLNLDVGRFKELCLQAAALDPEGTHALRLHQAKCLHMLFGHSPEFCAGQIGIEFPANYRIFDANKNLLVENCYALLNINEKEYLTKFRSYLSTVQI